MQTFDKKDLYPDILSKAAALMRSLIENHPFHDGNKRTAVMATIIFLQLNGYELRVPERKLIKLALAIVNSNPTLSVTRIRRTLKKYAHRTERRKDYRKTYRDQIYDFFKRLRS